MLISACLRFPSRWCPLLFLVLFVCFSFFRGVGKICVWVRQYYPWNVEIKVTCYLQPADYLFFFKTTSKIILSRGTPPPSQCSQTFVFWLHVKDRHNSGHSHGLVYVNREQNVCLIRRSSSYVLVWLHHPCSWTCTSWRFLVIMWTKKFMNMRDEYQMIHLSLAVIVLEFPSWSDPPLPPSPRPNGACTVSPPPSLHYIFLFLPGIWKLAGVRVSGMQAYCCHKRHQHTVQLSQEGGGELSWRDGEGKENKETKMLGAAMRLVTWPRLYSKHEEKHITALWSTLRVATLSSGHSWEATFTFIVCFKLVASILWPRSEGHMWAFVVIS